MTGIVTLPNMITASRILFLPLLYYLLHAGHLNLFLVIYVVAGSTDYFDGIAARRMQMVTHFGKELDSLADLFFYISSAYFVYKLQPAAIAANSAYLIVFFSLLGFSFLLSTVLFRRPVMMHTIILRWNAVSVFLIVIASFWIDTTIAVRLAAVIYMIGFAEEILIFIFYGQVDPDTKSIIHLMKKG